MTTNRLYRQGNQNQYMKIEKFDLVAKLALAYKFENLGRIERETYSAITSEVKDYFSRQNMILE